MRSAATRTATFPAGDQVPVLGQGTWYLGEDPGQRQTELTALRHGVDLGLTLIDTAEMYGNGAAEELVGEAIAGHQDEIFLVDKVLPQHATRRGTVDACRASLRRLGTDRIDLYLLHWVGSVPFSETIAGFEDLITAGDIRHWGVSNLDPGELASLCSEPGGDAVQTNQVLYNLTRRGVEFDVLPQCGQFGLPVMAYSPIEQGRLLGHPALTEVAGRHQATPAQIALAWVLRTDQIIAIPKAGTPEHVDDNHGALEIQLTADDLAALDHAFPPPTGPTPLEML